MYTTAPMESLFEGLAGPQIGPEVSVPPVAGPGEVLLPATSEIRIPVGTVLSLMFYSGGGANYAGPSYTVPAATAAKTATTHGTVRVQDSKDGSVTLLDRVQIGGEVWKAVVDALPAGSPGGQIDLHVPAGTKVLVVRAAAPPQLPLPGGSDVVGSTPPSAAMQQIWKDRASRAKSTAIWAAVLGGAGTVVLAASGHKRAAVAAGVVTGLAVATSAGVSIFAGRHVVAG